ncbi:FAD-dependent monooxygenase [Mycolicibacterium septicum]|uniref:FAD-dependent monooxygenase n=1 Tax=Mycolicibacterium septicum TaxID=98668 RepID=UPI002361C093|nr:FAD-dependent monooxygenase [Mycolicibacterium septicum]
MGSMRVVIVGAGIGGLTAALALQSVGVEVDVYEQARELAEVGAGLTLWAPSMRVLHRLGIGADVARHAVPLDVFHLRQSDGAAVGQTNTENPGSQATLYRPDLIETLVAAVGSDVVHIGHRCIGFSQDAHAAQVVFDNGVTTGADVVVGADGIHSVLQRHVVEPRPPVFSNQMAYRGVVPADRLPAFPCLDAVVWVGEGRHVVTFPMWSGELRNFVGFVPADQQMHESWSAPGDPAALAAEFAGWDPLLVALLRQVETTFRWGLYDRDPLAHWSRGRLTLLGDAAHAMLPHMGQGANQAVEDAMALAVLLRGLDTSDVPDALIRYERLRRGRTAAIQQGSRTNGELLDSGDANVGERPSQDYDVEAAAEALR